MSSKTITPAQLESLAAEFGLPVKSIKAVLQVESAGKGFSDKTGKIIIRFEQGVFMRSTKKAIVNLHVGQAGEWVSFDQAFKFSIPKAMEATSWGIAQIMGENYAACGFKSVNAMVTAFNLSEEEQIKGMLYFIKSQRPMFDALHSGEWAVFAQHYNGPNYRQNNYDVKLMEAFHAQV